MADAIAEFQKALFNEPIEKVLNERIFNGDVYAFRRDDTAMERLRTQLVADLSGPTTLDLLVVGSAKTGFSMDPISPFRKFHARSDIDLLLVSADLFDGAWRTLLEWNYAQPERYWPRREAGTWVGERRDDLWWGYLRPAEWARLAHRRGVLQDPYAAKSFGPVRDLSTKWFRALKGLARDRALAFREVNGRLYRTREHATLYHYDSLLKLRTALSKPPQE